ncbi:MAG: response regulator [Candidatus Thiodiazotropha sp. (ex Semelilucina semeliformis)]|nr:response regulator [Candidatus Thiodiazotropha sp. (ex Semelilucina semeliformis)]
MKQAFLVDDSKSARIVLSRLLKKSGFDEVEMAVSGEEALEQLKAITPDAIFVDFLMDGMDGLETINEIKKDPRFVTTPVVMCTANEGDEYVRAAVDHGALGILAKPPTHESLGEIIDLIDQHQMEVAAANDTASPQSESVAAPAETTAAAVPSPAPVSGLSEAEVRRIAEEIASSHAENAAAEAASRAVAEQVEAAVNGYLDERLEPLVNQLIDRQLKSQEPPAVDTDALQDEVVKRVNGQLEEFVRQLNQRTVEGLIEASIYEQISEVANDFSQRLRDTEQSILSQVPEKNEMIEHIRVVTEGSVEAQVLETSTHVAQEVANSVATETVEALVDQHLAHQSLVNQPPSNSAWIWAAGLVLAVAAGAGLYFYFF